MYFGSCLNCCRLRNNVRALASVMPTTFAAFSRKSGRPTSPKKTKSPC